ncbi:protein GPR107-like [Abrus precatorius]|uniref:Protein GPR107-like n=1 Tax=Abrus precatorius TaxID=3816 RepID=A0A8B8M5K4_ABRPR|nr:protein GPR107-like [Abrus precatorius]
MEKIAFTVFVTVLVLCLIPPSTAEIKTVTLTSDTRPMIIIDQFGFTRRGHLVISVSVASPIQPNPSQVGFFLVNQYALPQVLIQVQRNPNFCVLDSFYIFRLFTFRALSHSSPFPFFNRSYPVTSPNQYTLFFANCVPQSNISMNVHIEIFNLHPDGTRDYLSAGQTLLPSLFFLFSLVYFAFFFFWIFVCYLNKLSLRFIHFLMASLLLIKSLNLIFAAGDMYYVKVTGIPNHWVEVSLFIFQFIRVVLSFIVIVLLGTGWSFPKPFLRARGQVVLVMVILLQFLASFVSLVVPETRLFVEEWVNWNHLVLLVDFISCSVIIFLVVWSGETSEALTNLENSTLFKRFYMVVIGYLFFARFVLIGFKITVSYKDQWVSNLAEETIGLAFYVIMFYMFRPVERNEYFVLDEEEEVVVAVKKLELEP